MEVEVSLVFLVWKLLAFGFSNSAADQNQKLVVGKESNLLDPLVGQSLLILLLLLLFCLETHRAGGGGAGGDASRRPGRQSAAPAAALKWINFLMNGILNTPGQPAAPDFAGTRIAHEAARRVL